ncbi:unnamed protein product, partial [Durusdinium trenchii]
MHSTEALQGLLESLRDTTALTEEQQGQMANLAEVVHQRLADLEAAAQAAADAAAEEAAQ